MEASIIETALAQSIWAALSLVLIFYILKKQETRDAKQEIREAKYQEIIQTLTEKLNVINEVKDEVEEIKHMISK